MRVLMTMRIPAEAGNRAIKDGSLAKVLQDFLEKTKPEAAYFGVTQGKRTMFAVFDLASPSAIPPLDEPFLQGFDAEVDMTPIMDLADLQAGLAAA